MSVTGKAGARHALRKGTAGDHDRVDAAFSRFELGHREGYAAFLRAQARAFMPIEAALDRSDAIAQLPDWSRRRRSDALVADLAELGHPVEPDAASAGEGGSTFATIEDVLGAVYVLEGSRLGGQLLARSVPAGLPRRFLDAGDATLWRTLVAAIDKMLITKEQIATATVAARAVFARFEKEALAER